MASLLCKMGGIEGTQRSNLPQAPPNNTTINAGSKRSLQSMDNNHTPRKRRKCSPNPSETTQKLKEQIYGNLHLNNNHEDISMHNPYLNESQQSQQSQPQTIANNSTQTQNIAILSGNNRAPHPTVTILSSYDANHNHSENQTAPATLRADNHETNTHKASSILSTSHQIQSSLSVQSQQQQSMDVNMDTKMDEDDHNMLLLQQQQQQQQQEQGLTNTADTSSTTELTETMDISQTQKKPVFSMTIQKKSKGVMINGNGMNAGNSDIPNIPVFNCSNEKLQANEDEISSHSQIGEGHQNENVQIMDEIHENDHSPDTTESVGNGENKENEGHSVNADFDKDIDDEEIIDGDDARELLKCRISKKTQLIPHSNPIKTEHDNNNNQIISIQDPTDEENKKQQTYEDNPIKATSTKLKTKVIRAMRLLLDAKRVGGLIGKGGVAITKIRQTSQAKILIAKPIPHSLFRICSIEGEYQEIVTAICLIIDKMAEESTKLPPYQITILVEEKNIGCLIGKKGNAITEIRNTTNANIYISSHLLRNSSEKTVDICGERNAVHCAIKMVIRRLCENPAFASTRMLYDPQLDFLPSQPLQQQTTAPLTAKSLIINSDANKGLINVGLNGLYPQYFQHAATNGRLLNYALNRLGSLPAAVQPQIITGNSPSAASPNRLISPMASRQLAAATLLAPSLLTNGLTPSPYVRATPISPYNSNNIPLSTKTASSTNPHSANPPQTISPNLSQRNDNNSFVNNSLLIQSCNGKPGNSPIDTNNNSHNLRNNRNHRNTRNIRNSRNNSSYSLPPSNASNTNNNNHRNNHHHNHTNTNNNNNRNNNNNVINNRNNNRTATTINGHGPPTQIFPTHYNTPNVYYNPRLIGTVSPISPPRAAGQNSPTSVTRTAPMPNITVSTTQQTSVVFPVAAHLIGGVIGRGGRNIQEIRRQTNAEIKIDNERQNQTTERYITINGTAQQIQTAVQMIQNSLATTTTHHTYP